MAGENRSSVFPCLTVNGVDRGGGWELGKELDVLCVGFVNQDLILQGIEPDALQRDTTHAKASAIAVGGDAANQVVTLSRLGKRTALAATIGQDLVGEGIYQLLAADGVDLSYCPREGVEQSVISVVVIKPDGERSFLVGKGKGNLDISLDQIDLTVLDHVRAVSLGSLFFLRNMDQGQAAELFRLAKEKQVLTFADMTADAYQIGPDGVASVYPYTDYLMPSYEEASYASGLTDIDEIADFSLNKGVGNIIIKLGGHGCYIKNSETAFYTDTYQISPVDTTGCGDNFCAGFISCILDGRSLVQSARFACAAGAVNALHLGAHGNVNSREQVEEFMRVTPLSMTDRTAR